MPSSDNSTRSISEEIEQERLRVWREKRAKIAEQSRQEREKIAEGERRNRQKQQEEEKQQRLRHAADLRAKQEAEKRAERMNAARSRIAGRTDIESARKRLLEYRKIEARNFAIRLVLCVGLPTALIAVYLFAVSTPLYVAETKFALVSTAQDTVGAETSSPFSTSPSAQQAHQLRSYILAPQMLATLDEKNGFSDHFSSDQMDPVTRMYPQNGLQLSKIGQFKRYVDVSVNGQEGLVSVKVQAAAPEKAKAFADTILASVSSFASDGPSSTQSKLRIISPPTSSEIALLPRRIPSIVLSLILFASLYGIASVFLGSLKRHGAH